MCKQEQFILRFCTNKTFIFKRRAYRNNILKVQKNRKNVGMEMTGWKHLQEFRNCFVFILCNTFYVPPILVLSTCIVIRPSPSIRLSYKLATHRRVTSHHKIQNRHFHRSPFGEFYMLRSCSCSSYGCIKKFGFSSSHSTTNGT